METYILKNSNRKGKRYLLEMPKYKHSHHFGSAGGKTYIDHNDDKKKAAWIARHKKDKNYNNKHSGIFHSRELLWTEKNLNKSIKRYEIKYNIKIINKIK